PMEETGLGHPMEETFFLSRDGRASMKDFAEKAKAFYETTDMDGPLWFDGLKYRVLHTAFGWAIDGDGSAIPVLRYERPPASKFMGFGRGNLAGLAREIWDDPIARIHVILA